MLKKILTFSLLLLCLTASPALSDPGHDELPSISPEKPQKLNKKIARAEVQKTMKALQREVASSKNLWQKLRPTWDSDKACVREVYFSLPDNSPLTDAQALYTLLALRAAQVHVSGPDKKTHASFRETKQRLFSFRGNLKTKALRSIPDSKLFYMRSISSLPKLGPLCQKLDKWQEAGSPDLQNYFQLYKYQMQIESVDETGQTSFSENIFYNIYPTDSYSDFSKVNKRLKWLRSATPYSESLKTNAAVWKNWISEIDLD